MKNPFQDFLSIKVKSKEIPLQGIVRAQEERIAHLIHRYSEVIDDAVSDQYRPGGEGWWDRVYERIAKGIPDVAYDRDDIQDLCAELDRSASEPCLIKEIAGLYISALINHASEDHHVLILEDEQITHSFLGYRLPRGKALTLQGNAGDFIGARLAGGHLAVEGSAGNWCGAGMAHGKIEVKGNIGHNAGAWMEGGELRAAGHIRSVGKNLLGGSIYQGTRLLAPSEENVEKE
ncbi:MAG: hypothetical protein ABSG91_09700 [Syntrophobacteraceae bacterium]|jgi:hypothetical protein